MEEFTTIIAGEDVVPTPLRLVYMVNMIDGCQYDISKTDYETLRGLLAEDKLSGIYIINPDTPQAIILTVRNIVSLGVEEAETEVYDG
jgi:hypothetical protein